MSKSVQVGQSFEYIKALETGGMCVGEYAVIHLLRFAYVEGIELHWCVRARTQSAAWIITQRSECECSYREKMKESLVDQAVTRGLAFQYYEEAMEKFEQITEDVKSRNYKLLQNVNRGNLSDPFESEVFNNSETPSEGSAL